jgi:ferredoxin
MTGDKPQLEVLTGMDTILQRMTCRCHQKRGVHVPQECLAVGRCESRCSIAILNMVYELAYSIAGPSVMDWVFTTHFVSLQLFPDF